MNNNFPQVLYPVFRLQQSTQRAILGNKWWKKKVTELGVKEGYAYNDLEQLRFFDLARMDRGQLSSGA